MKTRFNNLIGKSQEEKLVTGFWPTRNNNNLGLDK